MLDIFISAAQNIFDKYTLNFKEVGLGTESWKIVAKIIEIYRYCEGEDRSYKWSLPNKLILWNNMIKDDGLKWLVNVIASHKRLVYLNLQNNELTDDSFWTLFFNLQHNRSIVSLEIGNTTILGRNRLK